MDMNTNTRAHDIAGLAAMLADDPAMEAKVRAESAEREFVVGLTSARLRRRMTQADVAKKLNVSVSKVSRLEASRVSDLTVGELRAYANAVGFSLVLFGDDTTLPAAARIKECVL